MPIERLNPEAMHEPTGYAHVVRVETTATAYISGQVAVDPAGNVVGAGDLEVQARQVFTNLRTALEAVGASFGQVVKMNTYIVGYQPEMRDTYRRVRDEFMPGLLPASTLIGVQALARSELLIEIEAVAALDR